MTDGLIAKKITNVLVTDAELKPWLARLMNYQTLRLVEPLLGRMRRTYSGLWVGGDLFLYRDHLSFKPNAANRAIHSSDTAQYVPLSAVTAVVSRFGLLTGIVDVEFCGKCLTFRCFGSKAFAQTIRDAVAAVNSN